MGCRTVGEFAREFKEMLSPEALDAKGREVGLCQRRREIAPGRLATSLLASFACGRVETLADLQRQYNALHGRRVSYKAFHKQLAKPAFAGFARGLFDLIVGQWAIRTLRTTEGLAGFDRVVIQDGSSFAVKDALRERFPGRFKTVSPAAVELHATMELLEGTAARTALTADTGAERPHLPDADSLRGALLLADRGYFDVDHLAAVDGAGGHFVARAPESINPTVLRATANGRELASLQDQPLKQCDLPKTGVVDLDVNWRRGAKAFRARLAARWNPKREAYVLLVTNLPRERVSAEQIGQAYRLRWQVELMFKEWKSHANLRAFDTANANIAEGLVWAALAAAALKRHIAHATQVLRRVEVSTRKVAMCARHGLDGVLRTLAAGKRRSLHAAIRNLIDCLAHNATPSHPKRDRRTGRLQFGLEPVL